MHINWLIKKSINNLALNLSSIINTMLVSYRVARLNFGNKFGTKA